MKTTFALASVTFLAGVVTLDVGVQMSPAAAADRYMEKK